MQTFIARSLLLIVISLTCTLHGHSQRTLIGARLGIGFSNWNINDADVPATSAIMVPEAGIFAEFKLTRAFSLQPELAYGGRGGKIDFGSTYIKFRSGYVQLPLLAKYYLPNGIAFFAGPEISILLSATGSSPEENKINAKGLFKNHEFGVATGLEYNLKNGLSIQGRYYGGLSNIYRIKGSTERIKNYSFGFAIGYKLSAGKWK